MLIYKKPSCGKYYYLAKKKILLAINECSSKTIPLVCVIVDTVLIRGRKIVVNRAPFVNRSCAPDPVIALTNCRPTFSKQDFDKHICKTRIQKRSFKRAHIWMDWLVMGSFSFEISLKDARRSSDKADGKEWVSR